MGVLRPIVAALVLAMLHVSEEIVFCGTRVGTLVGDDHAGNVVASFAQLAEERLGGSRVATALDQYIQHGSVLINRAPKIVLFPIDLQKDLIKMPCVTRLGAAMASLIRICLPERLALLASGFIGYAHTTFSA